MAEKPSEGFYARFLGGFSLYFSGQEIFLEVNSHGKTMQLIYFLLKAGTKGCEKKELLELIRPGEKNTKKRMNNFRQQVFRIRKQIHQAGFPEGKYIVYQENRYYFTRDYPLYADTEKLDDLIGQIQSWPGIREGAGDIREEKQKPWQQYEEYCEAYTGEFLPVLGGEEWVALESAYYQKWYFICLNQLSVQLKKQKNYERLLRLVEAASQFHPYDEWQVVQIECLMALGRRKEAEKVYEEARELFDKDLGVNSLEQAMESYPQRMKCGSAMCVLEEVKECLEEKEKEKRGAYYCSYSSFIDFYRIRARMDEMNQEQSFLLLCTLSDAQGEGEEKEGRKQMELFQETLVQQIRSEDVYTQYSENQYLVLLSAVGHENEKGMLSRLKNSWERAGGQAKVEFSIDEVEGVRPSECF